MLQCSSTVLTYVNALNTMQNLSKLRFQLLRTNYQMTVALSDRVRVPQGVLVSGLQQESVLLNLDSERYFGLDDVGTRMFSLLSSSDSIEAAWRVLLEEYEVEPDVLKADLLSLADSLIQQGLLEVSND